MWDIYLFGTKLDSPFSVIQYLSFFNFGNLILLFWNTNYFTIELPSHIWLSVTTWTAAWQASLSSTISESLPDFMSITSVMPSSHVILWRPLLLSSNFPSIRDFSNESSVHIRWPKYWSFNFSIRRIIIQGWFTLRLTGLISFLSKGPSGVFFSTTIGRY